MIKHFFLTTVSQFLGRVCTCSRDSKIRNVLVQELVPGNLKECTSSSRERLVSRCFESYVARHKSHVYERICLLERKFLATVNPLSILLPHVKEFKVDRRRQNCEESF